jgi:predicted Zn-dependent peptidase
MEYLIFWSICILRNEKKRPTPLDIAEPLDKIGGVFNAFTSQEYTGYFAKVETSNFPVALDIVSDIFLNSVLPQQEIEKEKGVIIEEINMIDDHPMSKVGVLWQKLLWRSAGCWGIIGTKIQLYP